MSPIPALNTDAAETLLFGFKLESYRVLCRNSVLTTNRFGQVVTNGVSLTRPAAVKRSLHLSFASLIFPLCPSSTPLHLRRSALSLDGSFSSSNRCSVSTRLAQPRVPSSLRCCPPNISSILTDHDEVFELPGYPRRAGSLINRPVTFRTIRRSWHPRTGCTALLLLPATTELWIINFVPQHNP